MDIWVKVFKNGPSKICGRQTLKNFTWPILEYLDPYMGLKIHTYQEKSEFFMEKKNRNFP